MQPPYRRQASRNRLPVSTGLMLAISGQPAHAFVAFDDSMRPDLQRARVVASFASYVGVFLEPSFINWPISFCACGRPTDVDEAIPAGGNLRIGRKARDVNQTLGIRDRLLVERRKAIRKATSRQTRPTPNLATSDSRSRIAPRGHRRYRRNLAGTSRARPPSHQAGQPAIGPRRREQRGAIPIARGQPFLDPAKHMSLASASSLPTPVAVPNGHDRDNRYSAQSGHEHIRQRVHARRSGRHIHCFLEVTCEVVVGQEKTGHGTFENYNLDILVRLECCDDLVQLRDAIWSENIKRRVIEHRHASKPGYGAPGKSADVDLRLPFSSPWSWQKIFVSPGPLLRFA